MNKKWQLLCFLLAILFNLKTMAQWETLANIPEKLSFPVVTVLNGKIHVMGGGGGSGATDAHYQYDPETNKWESLSPTPYYAQQPAGASVLGRIHFFGGGFPNSGNPTNQHYAYDPKTNTWTPQANLSAARAIHYAVVLNDSLYSIAGQGMKQLFEVYDTSRKIWSKRADLPDANFWYGAHIAAGGSIFRFGGGGYNVPQSSSHKYNVKNNSWQSIMDMPMAVHGLSGAAIGDSIYLGGGYNAGKELDNVWIYNIKTDSYLEGPKLKSPRDYHRMVSIGRCIYSVGGNSNSNSDMALSLIRHCPGITAKIAHKNENKATITVVSNKITIQFESENDWIYVELIDAMGKTIFSKSNLPLNSKFLEIETQEFTSGLYSVNILGNAQSFSKKVMLVK